MSTPRFRLAIACGLIPLYSCSSTPPSEVQAQLFEQMGTHGRSITTDSKTAQRYFDQGLTWTYAFNHDEAIRSFTRASELDTSCAMAWWGVALCQGPNYNDAVMTDERSAASWRALQNALARIDRTTPVERALIEALRQRYAETAPKDRKDLDKAYAAAMGGVFEAFPDDADVGTLYADAMMVLRPWKLYALDFTPAEDTETIVSVLEKVMAMAPNHPGANHLYIHAVEPSSDPDRGLSAASRLGDLVHGSGHLLHMPSHIYVNTGHWNEAIVQNQKAMASDVIYRRLSPNQGIQNGYMVHNAHMLAFAAMMSGREREAMVAARRMWADLPEQALRVVGAFIDPWMSSVYDVQKRFGRWDDILAEKAPPTFLPITTAIWRAHRAIAHAAKKDFENAERELAAFRAAAKALPKDHRSGDDPSARVLEVSDFFIQGEIALQRGQWRRAAQLLERGAAVEDTLSYGEPPQWLQPIRHTLGAVYLSSKRFADAERVYRKDLAKWPNNGWSLYGLYRALEEQGKTTDAAEIKAQFERAWAGADWRIVTSCLCVSKT